MFAAWNGAFLLASLAVLLPGGVLGQAADTAALGSPAPDTTRGSVAGRAPGSPSLQPDPALAQSLRTEGLENLTALRATRMAEVGYENRRYRHSATALGVVARSTEAPTLAYERRLGMVAAAVRVPGDTTTPSQVWYPSDGDFIALPPGPVLAPTRRSVDLLVGPLITYDLGRILDPVLLRIELQPELRYNPWPGGRMRAALVIPLRNDFDEDDLHPDVNNLRPGPVALEQFAWSPGNALFSGTGGLLGNNRYGLSLGVARPISGGDWLLDAQADVTGFVAFNDSGVTYSTPSRWTGFAGVTYRPPGLDLGIRLRAERFIHDDDGLELEVRRAMGDVDVGLYALRVQGETVGGVRLVLPVPPTDRPSGWPVRFLPVERFPFQYREESLPVGVRVGNVASREDYLRQLDRSSLKANGHRFRAGLAGSGHARKMDDQVRWVSLTGMTGFVHTPWCGVMGDREIEFGANSIPKGASWTSRGEHANDVYYAALGFLPHVEVGLRWTVIPGLHPFQEEVPESRYVDSDRMFSGRIELLEPRASRPGLAVGVEDARGTRRFHSSYAVAGTAFDIYRLQNRVTVGYAPPVFKEVGGRTLDGLFGACEVSPWRSVALSVEHDSEKWSSMLAVAPGLGFRVRVALLDLEHLSFGAGWFKAL